MGEGDRGGVELGGGASGDCDAQNATEGLEREQEGERRKENIKLSLHTSYDESNLKCSVSERSASMG